MARPLSALGLRCPSNPAVSLLEQLENALRHLICLSQHRLR